MPRTFDFDANLRWFRRTQRKRLDRRSDDQLPLLHDTSELHGQALLLDTCVYIDQIYGHAPTIVDRLIDARILCHSVVALQELLHSVGALDPADGRTATTIKGIGTLIERMQPRRILEVDVETSARAALLSGALCRLRSYGTDSRLRALADATLFLQVQKAGCTFLTSNLRDFDLLLQMVPAARVLIYRPTGGFA